MARVTQAQLEELAGVVSAQAASIAAAQIPVEDYRAKVLLLLNNVTTLEAWTAPVGVAGEEWHTVPRVRTTAPAWHDMHTAAEVSADDRKCLDSGEHRVSARHTPGDCPLLRNV